MQPEMLFVLCAQQPLQFISRQSISKKLLKHTV